MRRRLEETAMNAWPALQQMLYDGWILRFGAGYTRRANSVNPLYESTLLDLDEKIAHCEALYAAQNLPCAFRLTSFGAPPGLDDRLDSRSYVHDASSLVQHLDLRTCALPQSDSYQLTTQPLDEWIVSFCQLAGKPVESHQTHKQMVNNILAARYLATLRDDGGEVVACGLAVLEADMVGLFDLLTGPARRNQGGGTALVAGLLRWAQDNGAAHAYLQVMENNAAARHLYEVKFGFQTAYNYWYRIHQAGGG